MDPEDDQPWANTESHLGVALSGDNKDPSLQSGSLNGIGGFADSRSGQDQHESYSNGNTAGEADGFDDDDDFGDFGQVEAAPPSEPSPPMAQESYAKPLRLLDFDDFSSSDMLHAATALIADDIFPNARMVAATSQPDETLGPLSRSVLQVSSSTLSLWSNLRQNPSPQPAEWRTSRIRRSYLVSLGVPVDLDQVLPTKKKPDQIVLTSRLAKSSSFPISTKESISANNLVPPQEKPSSDSPSRPASIPPINSHSGPSAPDFDADHARQISRVSEAALNNMTLEELQNHVRELERVKIEASTVLAYWIDKRNSSAEDKLKYEGVIESSIEYAQRLRKHTTKVAAIPRPSSGLLRTRSMNQTTDRR